MGRPNRTGGGGFKLSFFPLPYFRVGRFPKLPFSRGETHSEPFLGGLPGVPLFGMSPPFPGGIFKNPCLNPPLSFFFSPNTPFFYTFGGVPFTFFGTDTWGNPFLKRPIYKPPPEKVSLLFFLCVTYFPGCFIFPLICWEKNPLFGGIISPFGVLGV